MVVRMEARVVGGNGTGEEVAVFVGGLRNLRAGFVAVGKVLGSKGSLLLDSGTELIGTLLGNS